MKIRHIIVCLSVLILAACKSSQDAISPSDLEDFNLLVKNKRFLIESDRLHPQTTMALQQVLNSGILQGGDNANTISLIGNANFLKISGDSISSYLPFYGERHMQVGYGGNDSAIELEGVIKNYQIEQKKNKSYTIRFDAQSKNEGFRVFIILSPSLKSDMTITGNSRSSIRYTGSIKALESEL